MNKTALQEITGILCRPNPKQLIILLTVFFLIYSVLGSATGNTSGTEEDPVFWDFGSLTITDSNNDPLFCTVTLYNKDDGILTISNFTATLNIEKINSGSQLYIESKEKNLSLDFSIDGDSSDPVVRIENYGGSNPVGNYDLPGSPLTYVSVDAVNLSYSSVRLAVDCHDVDETIDISSLKIFKYAETLNEWVELPTRIDDKAVSADLDSLSVFVVSVVDGTDRSTNLSIGTVSVLDSIGGTLPAGIEFAGPEGTLAEAVGTLTVDEVPQGSHLIINSTQKNITLDFTLDGDARNPVILLEDFGDDNPATAYLPPDEPVKYLMIEAENLGYSGVDLTIYYPNISENFTIFRLAETFAYNEWEELPAVVDTTNDTISTSLNSLSIFALSKITPAGMKVLDNKNVPLTVEIKTYDHNKNPKIVKHGHTLSVDELPKPGYIKIDALVEKDVAVVFKSSYYSGGEIVLDNYARHNPEVIDPNRIPVKFVEIHARNLKYDRADIEIHYSDDEIGDLDENKLHISHFSGGVWVTLDSTVDPVNNMVRASTDSLSTFALVYNGTSVNTKKSIYRPGEMAEIMIVVLDSVGAPVSDASIRMNVTAGGSVEHLSTLTGSIVETSDPGVYEAAYMTGGEGQYNISCTAIIEGSESRFDTYFMVQSDYDFDIIRHAQGKIDPTKYDTFDVTIDITSYTDADTITIWEYVPADFEVYTDANVVEADNLKVLIWQRSLVNNRTSVNYSYSVPMEWPKLYQLGPVEIDYGNETFTEARVWWVVVDPEMIVNGDFSSGTGTDADNWIESDTTGDVKTEWDSSNENMYMHCSGGSGTNTGNSYCDQNFNYNGAIPPSSAYLDFDWWRDTNGAEASSVYVELKKPGAGSYTALWSNTEIGDQTWTTESNLDITSNFTTTGTYTLRLHAYFDVSGGSDYAYVRWDNVVLNITEAGDDNTAPNITDVTSYGVTRSQAHITWDTNQSDSDNRVKYSIYSNLSDHNWSSWDNNTDSVHILLTGLSPSTKYYYSAYSYNGTNNSLNSNSSVYNFTTAGNATAQGNVKDKGEGQLTCEITVYDEDGTTVLDSTTGHSFDLYDVPIGGYILFDALSSKNVSAKFKINDNSSNAVIILDDYGLNNQESTAAPGNPMKYMNVSATNLSYESVGIKISYTDAELGSMDESQLAIYHYKNGAWSELSTSVDATNNTVTATATSLSSFAVIETTTRYNATLYMYDTKGNADPADDKLVRTASLTNLPANGTTFDLGFIGDIYKNHTYVVEMQIHPNYDYEFDADYRKETFFKANNSFSLTDTSRQEYLVNTTLVTDDENRTEDIFVSMGHQVDYSDDDMTGECGWIVGDLDIMALVDGDNDLQWYQNDGTPKDVAEWSVYDANTTSVGTLSSDNDMVLGDLDNDGYLDAIIGNNDFDVRIYQNPKTTGTWTEVTVEGSLNGFGVTSVVVGDFNNDGWLDIVAGNKGGSGADVWVYENDGTPFTAEEWSYNVLVSSAGGNVEDLAVGDMDGDGDLDVVAGTESNDIIWWENDGTPFSGEWTARNIDTSTGETSNAIAVGDFDNDGDLDVVQGDDGSDIDIYQNNGSTPPSWTEVAVTTDAGGDVVSLTVGDIDGDGYIDIIAGIEDVNDVTWYRNDGTPWNGGWVAYDIDAAFGNTPWSVAVGDIDFDGDLDVVAGGNNEYITWYENNETTTNWKAVDLETDASATAAFGVVAVAVGDLDNDANSNILDYYYNDTEGAESGVDEYNGCDNLTADEDYSFYFIASVDDDWSDGTNDTITFYCGNEAGSGWALTEPKMYGAVRTPIKVNWTWNITTAPPVTLAVNISQAPADVTRGEVFSSMNASVNNTGTVNATNTWLNWTLPSGWSKQTGNLDGSLGILEPNEVNWNNLTVNLSQSAALGPQTVTAGADCDESAWGSDSKSITVYALTNVSQVTSNKTNPVQGDIILLSTRLLWDNNSDISGQNISFYNDSIYIGSDFTNSTGWAQVSWNTTGVGLQETINATYDGNATIYSRSSYNNSLTITFPDIIMTVYTNRSEYRPPAGVLINGNVTNITGGGPSAGATVNISVLYPNGTQAYYNQATTDSYGGYNTTYNLAANDPIGTYTVNTNATSATGNFTTNSTTFLVVGLVVSATTDKSAYLAGENVTITVYAEYNNNTNATNSLVNLTIKDPDETIINETSGYIDTDGDFDYVYTLPADAAEGTYSVTAKVTDPENYVEYASTSFDVARKAATLNVEPSITIMWQDQSKIFYLQVTNTGAENINGSVNLTTTDPLYFNITNITAKNFTNLTPGSQFTAEFNVTVNMTTPLDMYKLNASLSYDNDTKSSQKDVYIKVITEPELFVRTVTDKAVYLLDPYQWVYIASDSYWPPAYEGRPTVTINAMFIDQYGRLRPNGRYPDEPTVTYCVHNGSSGAPIISSGNMDKARTGFYTKTIEVNETTGVADYLVYVNVTGLGKEVSGSTTFTVDRWDCDSCHRPYGNKHGWNDVIGSSTYTGGSVTYLNLVNYELTHTPDSGTDDHEDVFYKTSSGCISCHTGDNTIECTNCHTTNYLQGEHAKVTTTGVSAPITNCANASCHGHINLGDLPGDLDNRYPNCSDCHPISFRDNFTITSQNQDLISVPQWLNTTTGTPRDIAVHPNPDNAIVNCSFCHNSFHNIYDEPDTLTCGDCHNESNDYSIHNGTYPSASYEYSANCTECHNFSSTHQIDIHNTITPACSECHTEVNHSSYNTSGVSCTQCHNDRFFNYSGSVLTNGTYLTNTSIHSENNLIPNCSDCHLGYSNHSSYDTDGVYCTYCHNNKTLNYNNYRNLLFDGTTYNTSYNTNTEIHTLDRNEMIPNCTDCHGSDEYKTHLGDATEVAAGTAANCTQCHDNVSLTYNSSGTVLSPGTSYNTNGEIHTMVRVEMLPNQTANLNDSCAVCHVTVYNETTRTHSNNNACYKCHFDPDVQYQGTIQDRPVEHTTNETIGCRACHFNYTRVADIIGKPRYFVNETMFNASVHGNQSAIDCRDCHTKYHRPPEYTWKWCECCHSYQADPVNETDRHNVTADPLSYSVNVGGTMTPVLNITDCTTCHDATQYNTARDTFNRTKNCRYCHTYPDQTYY